jgi:Phosphatidylinositol-glycan biosynthesis class S protein
VFFQQNIDIWQLSHETASNSTMSASSQALVEPGPDIYDENTKQNEDAPANAVSAAPKKKEPPPESSESIRQRGYVILSFWAIILIIGLPIWWKTTAIYRARLPLAQMMDWADGRVNLPICTWASSKLTSLGVSTGIPSPNIDRSRFITRPRSAASSANDPTCAGRLERLFGASFATRALSLQCIYSRDWTLYRRRGE